MLKFNNDIIHGAIFDMDGTMFDTERLRFQTLKQASRELIGVSFSDAYLMACLGLSASSAHQLAQQQYGQDIPYAEIRKRADELELESVRSLGVPIKKGLVQVLERLRKSGLRMAVATSSRRLIAEEYLINANVYKFFDVLVCGDEVQQGKPHPEIFLSAAEKLNLPSSECLMFEDSENGITSAYDAGGITILLQDIKQPNTNMLDKANYFFASMYDCLHELDQHIPSLNMPMLQEPFPQSLNQLTVGIHGFGAIGGGFMAQIMSHWDGYTRPKRIYASTHNPLYRSAVNAFGNYCIRYGQLSHDERIENMHIIDAGNIEQMQEMYTASSMIALCLPEHALASEAKTIAQGLYARYIAHEEQFIHPLTIIIILNKVGAKNALLAHLRNALGEITTLKVAEQILDQHYFCDTVVNRMVSKLTDQQLYRQLRIKYNIFKQYQLDHELDQADIEDATRLNPEQERLASMYVEEMCNNFKPSHILQNMDLILFHAEVDMPIYVENNSPLLDKMRQMILVEDIREIQLIKNRLWNGVHAMTAWYAARLGYETIGLAMADPKVREFMEGLLAEVKTGLALQFPHLNKDLDDLAQSFINSCIHAYKDPCARVARDPLRKLAAAERVLGSIVCNMQQELPCQYLSQGALYGYCYALQQKDISYGEIIEHLDIQLAQSELNEPYRQVFRQNIETHLAQQFTAQHKMHHPRSAQSSSKQLIS